MLLEGAANGDKTTIARLTSEPVAKRRETDGYAGHRGASDRLVPVPFRGLSRASLGAGHLTAGSSGPEGPEI